MREALGWSAFYIALPLAFGGWVWSGYGGEQGVEYFTGYLVEKSLSVDNLFVFMLLLAAFAVPAELAAAGAALRDRRRAGAARHLHRRSARSCSRRLDFAFLLFGAILLATAVKLLRDALSGQEHGGRHQQDAVGAAAAPVHAGGRRVPRHPDDRPRARPARAHPARRSSWSRCSATDIVFAVDSVPAVYGITGDPYLVFATNAFALLGLRALYFVLGALLGRLVHLSYGLAAILAFIGVKLGLHWAHGIWPACRRSRRWPRSASSSASSPWSRVTSLRPTGGTPVAATCSSRAPRSSSTPERLPRGLPSGPGWWAAAGGHYGGAVSAAAPLRRTVDGGDCTGELLDEGALVLHWAPVGAAPVLFSHPSVPVRPGTPPHAGIPVCWPWFGPGRSGDLTPSHGWARSTVWSFLGEDVDGGETTLRLRLTSDDADRPAVAAPVPARPRRPDGGAARGVALDDEHRRGAGRPRGGTARVPRRR